MAASKFDDDCSTTTFIEPTNKHLFYKCDFYDNQNHLDLDAKSNYDIGRVQTVYVSSLDDELIQTCFKVLLAYVCIYSFEIRAKLEIYVKRVPHTPCNSSESIRENRKLSIS